MTRVQWKRTGLYELSAVPPKKHFFLAEESTDAATITAAVGARPPRLLPLSENKLLTCHALFNMHLFGWRGMLMWRRAEGGRGVGRGVGSGARQHLLGGAGRRMHKQADGVV